jgi:hypothetical protein
MERDCLPGQQNHFVGQEKVGNQKKKKKMNAAALAESKQSLFQLLQLKHKQSQQGDHACAPTYTWHNTHN